MARKKPKKKPTRKPPARKPAPRPPKRKKPKPKNNDLALMGGEGSDNDPPAEELA